MRFRAFSIAVMSVLAPLCGCNATTEWCLDGPNGFSQLGEFAVTRERIVVANAEQRVDRGHCRVTSSWGRMRSYDLDGSLQHRERTDVFPYRGVVSGEHVVLSTGEFSELWGVEWSAPSTGWIDATHDGSVTRTGDLGGAIHSVTAIHDRVWFVSGNTLVEYDPATGGTTNIELGESVNRAVSQGGALLVGTPSGVRILDGDSGAQSFVASCSVGELVPEGRHGIAVLCGDGTHLEHVDRRTDLHTITEIDPSPASPPSLHGSTRSPFVLVAAGGGTALSSPAAPTESVIAYPVRDAAFAFDGALAVVTEDLSSTAGWIVREGASPQLISGLRVSAVAETPWGGIAAYGFRFESVGRSREEVWFYDDGLDAPSRVIELE